MFFGVYNVPSLPSFIPKLPHFSQISLFSSFVESTPISSILPDKGEVIVEAVEGCGHKVEAEHFLVLDDAVAQGGGRLVLQVDGAAEQELEGLRDKHDGDGVVGIVAASVSTGCHKHPLGFAIEVWFDCCEKLVSNLCDEHAHVEEEDDKAAIGGEVLRDHLVDVHSVGWLVFGSDCQHKCILCSKK